MKKYFNILLIILMVFLTTSCDPGTSYYNYDFLIENTKEIKLIDYHNENQNHFVSWVPNHEDELQSFDVNNYTVIEIMENKKHESFIDSLSKKDILYKYYAYDSPKDICIMITYNNDYFEIINCKKDSYAGYIGEYNASGEIVYFSGCFSNYDYFVELINENFDYKI